MALYFLNLGQRRFGYLFPNIFSLSVDGFSRNEMGLFEWAKMDKWSEESYDPCRCNDRYKLEISIKLSTTLRNIIVGRTKFNLLTDRLSSSSPLA